MFVFTQTWDKDNEHVRFYASASDKGEPQTYDAPTLVTERKEKEKGVCKKRY